MKIFFTILLLAPVSLFAQRLEVSLMAGPVISSIQNGTWDHKTSTSILGSLQALVNIKSFSFGLKADVYSIKSGFDYPSFNLSSGKEENLVIDNYPFNPAINLSLIANKKFHFTSSYFYAGINAGLLFGNSKIAFRNSKNLALPPNGDELLAEKGSASGISYGLQLGYSHSLNKLISMKAELAPRYISVTKAFGEQAHDFDAIAFPLTVGISFSL